MTGIYKITSPSGKIYIGQSKDISRRFKDYKRCRKEQCHLYSSISKHGYENHTFEVIHELPDDVTQEILDTYEILYYNQYKDIGKKMLNIREPSRRGKMSEESRRKISASLIGNKRSLGYKNTKETNEKKRQALIGRKMSDETKEKIRNTLLKRNKEKLCTRKSNN